MTSVDDPDFPTQVRRPCNAPFEASVVAWRGHLIWTRARTGKYGEFRSPDTKEKRQAHVYAWEQVNGPVPEGHELHHDCHIGLCVDPAHLIPLTRAQHRIVESTWRQENGLKKDRCSAGHLYDEENTYYRAGTNQWRMCRACQRIRHTAYRAVKRKEAG